MNGNEKLRILGIAPYEGLHNLMQNLARKRNDMMFDIITADLESSVEEISERSAFHYDAIISLGSTAKKIKENTNIPVVEIPLSMYDILRAIKLTEHYSGQFAIVGFSDVTDRAHLLCDLLQYDIEIFTVSDEEGIPLILDSLKEKNCTIILCDASTEFIAKKAGLTPILITSGTESIKTAFDTAANICKGLMKLQNENFVLQETLKNQSCSNFIFHSSGVLLLSCSNFQQESSHMIHYLSNLIPALEKESFCKSFHLIHDILYSVSLNVVHTAQDKYYIFTVDSNPVPQSGSKYGIRFSDEIEMRNYYYSSFYSLTSGSGSMNEQINRICQNPQPVMILGEKGSGKDQLAAKIYIESNLSKKPYISINCELINQKYWHYLITNYNSPLCDNRNTIFISNIQALSALQRKQLLSLALDTNLCKRNHVIFSCSTTLANSFEDPARDFIDYLPCITLNTPPLRELTNDLPSSSSLYLNKLNIEQSKEIIGLEPDAMDILMKYSWPQNYMQLKRVLAELVMLTDTPYIQASLVAQLIEKESIQFPVSKTIAESNFDYNRTLDEINRDIINHVIKQCNGNQSQAAKRLGISRTTIWRYIN
jgi:Response regulator containing CheY-like receiver, AAA-type ATPase, and DNA-binding domains